MKSNDDRLIRTETEALKSLAMSYFDLSFNTRGDKSLRAYSLPYNLNRFNRVKWKTTMKDLEDIDYFLDKVKHFP